MNLILFETRQSSYRIERDDPRYPHIVDVLGLTDGDHCYIGVVNGPRGLARIAHLSEPSLELTPTWETQVPSTLPLQLIVGLPRPQTARRILFEAACQGVRHLRWFGADKAEPSYRQSKLWATAEWRRHLMEGAEQAFSTTLPEVSHHNDLTEAISDVLPSWQKLALDVYEADAPLHQKIDADQAGVQLALGPERGWSNRERDLLRRNGFTLVHVGERVLKAETAVTAGITLIASAFGNLDTIWKPTTPQT